MMIQKVFVIILCMSAVKLEPEDIGSSGEGEATAIDVSPDPLFINNDGDLVLTSTLSSMDSEFLSNMDSNFEEALSDNTTTTREAKTEKASTTTTFSPVTTTLTTDTTTTTPYPTTVEETTTTSVETTTTTTTTTTAAPETTTTPKPTTTTKTPITTTRRTTRRTTTLSPTTKSTTTTVAPAHGEITDTPKPSGDLCEFVDKDLKCDVEIRCFGEGELVCSESVDKLSSESSILSQIFPETFGGMSDEYDYIDVETVPTFPPEQVGKTMFPSLFKFGSFATTAGTSMMPTSEDTTTEAKITEQETTVRATTTTERPTTTSIVTSTTTTTTVPTTITEVTTMASETEVSANSTGNEFGSNASTVFALAATDNLTEQNATMIPEDASTTMANADGGATVIQRRKREDMAQLFPSASPKSVSLHVAALEGPKEIFRSCKVIGNMVCSPTPTRGICRGRSVCRVIEDSSKDSEKPASAKSLENWTIAVIVMCIIAIILTVSIVTYFVVASWKKLKVQPQNGVTTLTYVNSTPP